MTIDVGKIIATMMVAVVLAMPTRALAQAAELARIDALQTLSETDNAGALRQLVSLASSFGPQTAYEVRREYLNTRAALEMDAAQLQQAQETQLQLLALAQNARDDIGLVLATTRAASIASLGGNTDAALARLAAIQPAVDRIRDPQALWNFHLVLGQTQLIASKFEAALASALKSQEYARQRPTQAKVSHLHSLGLLGRIYMDMTNWEKSLAVLEEALRLAADVQSSKLQASLHLNKGNVYNSMKMMAQSRAEYERALAISSDAGLKGLEGTAINNIADIYLHTADYGRAHELSLRALERFQAAGDSQGVVIAQANSGFSLMGLGKPAQGAAIVRAALEQSRQSGAKTDQELLLGDLAAMYERLGMYRDALSTMHAQQQLARELFRADREKTVAALQEQFDAAQRDRQIELLARENSLKDAEIKGRRLQMVVTLLGAAVVLLASGVIFLMYRRVSTANRLLSVANRALEISSARDPLTGLYNRRHFLELMDRRPADSSAGRREGDSPDGLLLLDIDNFKTVNDTHGHAAGDTVLREISARLRATVRETDLIMRWGGEEFLIFSPKSTTEHLMRLAERIVQAIGSTPVTTPGAALPITVSGGFVTLPFCGVPETECNWEKAMQFADTALYLAKSRGRNRAYGINRLLLPFAQTAPLLERDIAQALQENALELVEVLGPQQQH